MQPIRIFVGSDTSQRIAGAEMVLEHSIRKHASVPVEIMFMRAGDNFPVSAKVQPGHWCLGRAPNQAWPKVGSGTDFSMFRCAVPELAGFDGKAIYLDVDMLVLDDIKLLFDLPQKAPWLCNGKGRTEVALIDCAPFKNGWWPSIEQMQARAWMLPQYRQLLANHQFLDESLSWDWNTCDKVTASMKLLHYTSVPHQPWHPYSSVAYFPHPCDEAVRLWYDYLSEAREAAATT